MNEHKPDPPQSDQLRFAERSFINAQELNRFMDQKAGFAIAAVGILSTVIAAFGKDILLTKGCQGLQLYLQALSGCLGVMYFLMAFWTIYRGCQVFSAAPHTLKSSSSSPGLIFPLIILKRFNRDVSLFSSRLSSASSDELILDYCHQIMEISNIYAQKQAIINNTIASLKRLALVWVLTLISLIATTLAPGLATLTFPR